MANKLELTWVGKENEIKNQIAILRGKIDSIMENAIISND